MVAVGDRRRASWVARQGRAGFRCAVPALRRPGREQVVAGRLFEIRQDRIAGQETFGADAIGIDHLVMVEHDMQIGHAVTGLALHELAVDQVFGGHQHLDLAEQQFGHVPGIEHPVIRRDQKGRISALRACGRDGYRRQRALTVNAAPTDPANVLAAIVAGDDPVAGA